jgi:hypothetical protein
VNLVGCHVLCTKLWYLLFYGKWTRQIWCFLYCYIARNG